MCKKQTATQIERSEGWQKLLLNYISDRNVFFIFRALLFFIPPLIFLIVAFLFYRASRKFVIIFLFLALRLRITQSLYDKALGL